MEGTFDGFDRTPDVNINERAKGKKHEEEIEVTGKRGSHRTKRSRSSSSLTHSLRTEYETTGFRETLIGLLVWSKTMFFFVTLWTCRKARDLICGPPDECKFSVYTHVNFHQTLNSHTHAIFSSRKR